MHTKQIFQAQKQIQYLRHMQRLNKISKKKLNTQNNQSLVKMQAMHRSRNRSAKFQMKERQNILNYENNKILNKIIDIAERKELSPYSTVPSHYVPKKQSAIIIFDNPERKRRQKQILEDNSKLAKRLLTKNSEFDRSRISKQIEQYERIKKTMKNNRRIKLVPVRRNETLGFDFARVSTVQNSRVECHHIPKESNTIDVLDIKHQIVSEDIVD